MRSKKREKLKKEFGKEIILEIIEGVPPVCITMCRDFGAVPTTRFTLPSEVLRKLTKLRYKEVMSWLRRAYRVNSKCLPHGDIAKSISEKVLFRDAILTV